MQVSSQFLFRAFLSATNIVPSQIWSEFPVQSSPAQSSPVQSSPVQPIPVQSSPVQSSPVQSSPAQSSSVQPSPVQSSPVSTLNDNAVMQYIESQQEWDKIWLLVSEWAYSLLNVSVSEPGGGGSVAGIEAAPGCRVEREAKLIFQIKKRFSALSRFWITEPNKRKINKYMRFF
jgi:hypothetical protein